jgi:tetratricopeptide (TPR) repeat protein
MGKTQKSGRKKFYEYFCPTNEAHVVLMFKNKHLCKECSDETSKHVYMHKRCKFCKLDMKNSEKHYYQCVEYAKIKKPSNMASSLNHSDRTINLQSKVATILPNAIQSFISYLVEHQERFHYVIPIPKPEDTNRRATAEQLRVWFDQVKQMIADSSRLEEGTTKLESILKIAEISDIPDIDRIDMLATLSVCQWKRGHFEIANSFLEFCIQKATELGETNKWLEWLKWYAIRDIQQGLFQHAQGLIFPIIQKMEQDPNFIPLQNKRATFFNIYGMSLVGLGGRRSFELAEVNFQKAIDLDSIEPVYFHNLSDLYKKYYLEYNDEKCLDLALKNAETVTNPQYEKVFRKSAPASSVNFLNNMAEVYLLVGRIEDSEKALLAGFDLVQRHKLQDELSHARLFETQARILLKRGMTIDAHRSIQASLHIGRVKLKGTIYLAKFEKLFDEITDQILKSPKGFEEIGLLFDNSFLDYSGTDVFDGFSFE